jgi:hypothetical protein
LSTSLKPMTALAIISDVDEYRDGKVVSHFGGVVFGKDTPRLGVLMLAHPQVGDKFRSEDVPKITWGNYEMVAGSRKP